MLAVDLPCLGLELKLWREFFAKKFGKFAVKRYEELLSKGEHSLGAVYKVTKEFSDKKADLEFNEIRKAGRRSLIVGRIIIIVSLVAIPFVWHYFGWIWGILTPLVSYYVIGGAYSFITTTILAMKTGCTPKQIRYLQK